MKIKAQQQRSVSELVNDMSDFIAELDVCVLFTSYEYNMPFKFNLHKTFSVIFLNSDNQQSSKSSSALWYLFISTV
jgi:hypothetical protein